MSKLFFAVFNYRAPCLPHEQLTTLRLSKQINIYANCPKNFILFQIDIGGSVRAGGWPRSPRGCWGGRPSPPRSCSPGALFSTAGQCTSPTCQTRQVPWTVRTLNCGPEYHQKFFEQFFEQLSFFIQKHIRLQMTRSSLNINQ